METMTARTRTRIAVLLTALPLSAAALVGCGTEDDSAASDPTVPVAGSSRPTDPIPPPSESASDVGSPDTVAVPLYFVGQTPTGPRLYREFRNVEADNPVDEALALLAGGDVLDPDYSSLLVGTGLRGASQDENYLVEVSPDVALRPEGMSTKQARLAVQQVVYTVQGTLQERIPIAFVTAAGDSTTLFGLDTPTGGFKAAAQNDVLAFVNITEPAEGASLSGTITASGVANSFEATVPWQVLDEAGKKVAQGFATAEGWGDHLYPWQAEVDLSGLAPGSYTFVALTDDASDGEGGGPTRDTKTIAVE